MLNLAAQRIYVVGAGSFGLGLARIIKERGLEPTLIYRGDLGKLAIDKVSLVGDIKLPAAAIQDQNISLLKELRKDSIIFVCVKAYDLIPTLTALKPHLNETHSLVLTQNGLGIYSEAAEQFIYLPRQIRPNFVRLLPEIGFERTGTGVVSVRGKFKVSLSLPDSTNIESWKSYFEQLGAEVRVKATIAQAEWEKVALNIMVNPLATIANAPNRIIYEDREILKKACQMLEEVRLVAAKEGIEIPPQEELLTRIKNSGDNICSMLQDKRAGKPLELEHIVGRVIKLAEAYEIPVPILKRVYAELKG